jgi:hypothetical protein
MNIAVVGWASRTGIGTVTQSLLRAPWCKRWLVPGHPTLGRDAELLAASPVETISLEREDPVGIVASALRGMDAVIFCETPLMQRKLPEACRQMALPMVCLPMLEWLPYEGNGWVNQVAAMVATTPYCYRGLMEESNRRERLGVRFTWNNRICYVPWGVNLDEYPFEKRTRAERFLFINGYGGCMGRKGAQVVAAAAERARGCKVTVFSQTPELPAFPRNVEVHRVNARHPSELYRHGDVLLAPSLYEGLGLQHYEAAAVGLPVLTTDAPPMNEAPNVAVVRVAERRRDQPGERQVELCTPDAGELAALMTSLSVRDIGPISERGRAMIESAHTEPAMHHGIGLVLGDVTGLGLHVV